MNPDTALYPRRLSSSVWNSVLTSIFQNMQGDSLITGNVLKKAVSLLNVSKK
jgi:hypothetical protein